MRKIKILPSFALIVIICIVAFSIKTFKTQSLVELLDVNVDEINSVFVVDGENNIINNLNETGDLIRFKEILKQMNVKRVWNPSDLRDYILSFTSDNVNFRISISNKGTVFIQDDLLKGYKIVDDELLENLLMLLE